MGGTPGTILYLCSYDIFKDWFSKKFDNEENGSESFTVHFLSGILAEAVGEFFFR